jgi:hypothetical protein
MPAPAHLERLHLVALATATERHQMSGKTEFQAKAKIKQTSSTSSSSVHSSIDSPGMKTFSSVISHLNPSILGFD